MKKILIFLFFIVNLVAKAQGFELKDKHLLKYYALTNEAENKIIINDLTGANNLYKEAFKEFKYPHAKDLQNSMNVGLKTKDLETAYKSYQILKCLGQNFSDNFLAENFKDSKNFKTVPCKNTIDLKYKKNLDSLYKIDQYYRKLSNGNYQAYKKELTKNDSIASTSLLKLIQKKGFPNEYNIGLASSDNMFYQNFYFIIWHQLASNLYSSQKVNFSDEIVKALNKGKIRPDIAGQLFDLNNATNNYSFFKIYQFSINNGKIDCCYISEAILPEKRAAKVSIKINEINRKRKLIGLSTTEEEVRKNIFFLNNKDYVFTSISIEGFQLKNDSDAENMKKYLIKLNDITH
ncbi:hypothetical protein SAMN05421664_0469 [Chryseobacterium soldanellicola]|uniref:Uncharacterized protein n=1 Tax=Chryseobacterium soldanellicola TaxID=311333 RepID=A0A1H0Y457_9FLAO|nr:hypothetical protein [Chryseobacterium soldanellicola]SDQ09870.1 hypothetical protein SAMN05421664_0469 [Chryseobacterium soldanellicola]